MALANRRFALLDLTLSGRHPMHHFYSEHLELVAEQPCVELLPLLARQFDEPIPEINCENID